MTAPELESPDEDKDVQNDAGTESVLRRLLLVFVFGMIPVIGLLIYLNISKADEEVVEKEPVVPEGRQVDETAVPDALMPDAPMVDATE